MAGFIELATLKAPVVADAKGFKVGMSIVKKEGKDAANEIEKDFQNAAYATIRGFVQKFERLGLLSSTKYGTRIKYKINT